MDEQGRFWEEYEWCEDDLYEEDNYKKVCSWKKIYWKCGLCIYKPEELQCELDALMEGGAGYIAASVDDFINILLWYKYIPITKKVFDGFEEFIEDYQRDEYSQNTSKIINEFIQSEHLDLDNRMVYEKFLKGVSLVPVFIIEPTDEEYEISENLFRFDEEEFYEKLRRQ